MKKPYYITAIVIVHGKSELQICQFIKRNLRLPIEIISDSNGEKSIQITSLKNTIFNTKFKSINSFIKNYPVEYDKKNKKLSPYFKIFMIMDTDDCTKEQVEMYKNKEMFKQHWAYDYFYPIYNSTNLEDVMSKAGIPYKTSGKSRKKEYIKIFPTDSDYNKSDALQLQEFFDKLKKISKYKISNFEDFVEFCISRSIID